MLPVSSFFGYLLFLPFQEKTACRQRDADPCKKIPCHMDHKLPLVIAWNSGGNDAFNDMVDSYNDFIRDSNRIDASKLDNKKK